MYRFRAGLIYFQRNVLIRCFISSTKNWLTGLNESSLGVASKYKAPRIKFFVESVRKNWLAVATSPCTLKKEPCTLSEIFIIESLIYEAFMECLFVRL